MGRGPSEHRLEHPLAAGPNEVEWTVTVDEPRLWWPWSLGAQPLYEVAVQVELDGDGPLDLVGPRREGMLEAVLARVLDPRTGHNGACRGHVELGAHGDQRAGLLGFAAQRASGNCAQVRLCSTPPRAQMPPGFRSG